MFWCVLVTVTALAAPPSGQIAYLALGEGARQVAMLDLASGDTRPVGTGTQDGAPVWSPGGDRLAFSTAAGDTRRIAIVSPDTAAFEKLPGAHAWNTHPRWSSDGSAIAYEVSPGAGSLPRLAVHDFHTGREILWGGGREGLFRPVWLPNLDLRLFLDPDHELSIEGVDLGRLWAEAEVSGAVLAVGTTRALGRISTEIYVVTETQVMPLLLDMIAEDSERFVEWGCAVDRKGRQVAFESNDGGDREIYMLGSRGLVNLSNDRHADWNPVWSPRKNWLAFESFRGGRQGVYAVYTKTANVRPVVAGDDFDARSPAWSPDGKWLACVVDEGARSGLRIQAVEEGTPPIDYSLPSPGVAAPAWRPEARP